MSFERWDQYRNMREALDRVPHVVEAAMEGIVRPALAELADRDDVQIVYPVHPNPNVQAPVRRHLTGRVRAGSMLRLYSSRNP